MNEVEPELEIEQEWSKIKEMYSSTCKEVLGKAQREWKAWMSENTWRLVEERHVLKAMLEATKTRQQKLAAVERYNEKNHEVKRSCRRDTVPPETIYPLGRGKTKGPAVNSPRWDKFLNLVLDGRDQMPRQARRGISR